MKIMTFQWTVLYEDHDISVDCPVYMKIMTFQWTVLYEDHDISVDCPV